MRRLGCGHSRCKVSKQFRGDMNYAYSTIRIAQIGKENTAKLWVQKEIMIRNSNSPNCLALGSQTQNHWACHSGKRPNCFPFEQATPCTRQERPVFIFKRFLCWQSFTSHQKLTVQRQSQIPSMLFNCRWKLENGRIFPPPPPVSCQKRQQWRLYLAHQVKLSASSDAGIQQLAS